MIKELIPGYTWICLISGRSKAGKDTLADLLVRIINSKLFNKVYKVSFADSLKATASRLSGIPIEYFYDLDKKDTILPRCYHGRAFVCSHYYTVDLDPIENTKEKHRVLIIGDKETPRGLLNRLGASAKIFQDTVIADAAAEAVSNRLGSCIIPDLRYPSELSRLEYKTEIVPTILLLDPGESVKGSGYESDRLAYDDSLWQGHPRYKIMTREVTDSDKRIIEKYAEFISPRLNITENMSIAKTVAVTIDLMLARGMLEII